MCAAVNLQVLSPNIRYSDGNIEADYEYENVRCAVDERTNTCEDSLLASPLILDLAILGELFSRVTFKVHGGENSKFQKFNSVLSILSYLCKAPLVERGGRVINALFKQRATIENMLRALIALPPVNHMDMQFKCSDPAAWVEELKEPIVNAKTAELESAYAPMMRNGVVAGH